MARNYASARGTSSAQAVKIATRGGEGRGKAEVARGRWASPPGRPKAVARQPRAGADGGGSSGLQTAGLWRALSQGARQWRDRPTGCDGPRGWDAHRAKASSG